MFLVFTSLFTMDGQWLLNDCYFKCCKWFAHVYQIKNEPCFFIGKSIERFLHGEDGPIAALSIDCLKPPIGSGNILEFIPSHLHCDIGVLPFQNIFCGLIETLTMKNGRWTVPQL